MAQLVLNGKIDPKLSYHTMFATRETQSQLQRFTIQCNREKLWVCSSSQTSAPTLGNVASTNYSNIGRYLAHNVAALPTVYMQIAWDVSLQMHEGKHFIMFDRPWLIWNKTFNFKKDQFFRIA